MLILELGNVVNVAVNNNPQGIRLVLRGDLGLGERLGHDGYVVLVVLQETSDGCGDFQKMNKRDDGDGIVSKKRSREEE